LTLTVTGSPSSTASNETIVLHGLKAGFTPTGSELDTDWSESSLAWANAPANDTGSVNSFTSDAESIDTVAITTTPTAGTQLSFTIDELGDYVQDDDTVTLMITISDDSGLLYFASRENTNDDGPQLEFVVPEPSSMALTGLGLLLFAGANRRK